MPTLATPTLSTVSENESPEQYVPTPSKSFENESPSEGSIESSRNTIHEIIGEILNENTALVEQNRILREIISDCLWQFELLRERFVVNSHADMVQNTNAANAAERARAFLTEMTPVSSERCPNR